MRLAVAMALHPRIGEESLLFQIAHQVAQDFILPSTKVLDFTVLKYLTYLHKNTAHQPPQGSIQKGASEGAWKI
jgi:hypothetical protein